MKEGGHSEGPGALQEKAAEGVQWWLSQSLM